jgi:hypothetical protein
VTGADGVYRFPGSETGLLPDVGFYSAARFSLIVDRDKHIPLAPELAEGRLAVPGRRRDGRFDI